MVYLICTPSALGPAALVLLGVHIRQTTRAHVTNTKYVPLCVGGSKGKVGIHLKYYPENRDTFEMYPEKVMHMIGG